MAQAAEADPMAHGVPSWVERDFRAYLCCGILAHGFARARCAGCGCDFLVAFSCKRRGECPSCRARRMVEEYFAHPGHNHVAGTISVGIGLASR